MKYLLFLFSLFSGFDSFAQKRGSTWCFGQNAGIKFGECGAYALSDVIIDGLEGCAAISDSATGELLFYTNNELIYNRKHEVMDNGQLDSHVQGKNATQVLIVPHPGDKNLYYVFTTQEVSSKDYGFRYTMVDMSQNGGDGKVISKEIKLVAHNVTEKVCGVKHANGRDYWVMGHEFGNNRFFAFLVNENGVSLTPVISESGTSHDMIKITFATNSMGEMRFSPDGKKLALVKFAESNIELFDFDNVSGTVSNPMLVMGMERESWPGVLYPGTSLYSLAFSLNSWFLYVTAVEGIDEGHLMQFDLQSGDSAIIGASRHFIHTAYGITSVALGPDGRIYCSLDRSEYLAVIRSPDSKGVACDFEVNGVFLLGNKDVYGLSNLIWEGLIPIDKTLAIVNPDTAVCGSVEITFSTDKPRDLYRWYTDGIYYGEHETIKREFTVPGNSTYETVACSKCLDVKCDTVFTVVYDSIWTDLPTTITSCGQVDEEICPKSNQTHTEFTWPNGSTASCYTFTQAGEYSIGIRNGVCHQKHHLAIAEHAMPDFTLTQLDTPCLDGSNYYTLEIQPDTFKTIYWNGELKPGPRIELSSNETINVEVITQEGCTRNILFSPAEGCDNQTYIPNAFSPNGDGLNDILYMTDLQRYSISMNIYNRWGQLVFSSNEVQKGWDGTFKGKKVTTGAYVVILHLRTPGSPDNVEEVKHLVIHLLE